MQQNYGVIELVNNVMGFAATPLLSAALSAAGFSIGTRINKNNSDRQKKRELYQNCYQYFTHLKEVISFERPLSYSDIHESKEWEKWKLNDLVKSGGDALIPKKIAAKLVKTELEYFDFSIISQNLSENIADLLAEKPYTKELSSVLEDKPVSFVEVDPIVLINKDILLHLLEIIERNKTEEIRINPRSRRWKRHKILVSQQCIGEDLSSGLLHEIYTEIDAMEEVKIYRKSREKISDDLTKICQDLHRRIGDPDPFWETVRATFIDVFRWRT